MPPNAGSARSWADAIAQLHHIADDIRSRWICNGPGEYVSLQDAAGRKVLNECISHEDTPKFDTSAMDGFAISSLATQDASPSNPTLFRVVGLVTSGKSLLGHGSAHTIGMQPCVEIMTGGRFPDVAGPLGDLDACVKIEDVSVIEYGADSTERWKCIVVIKPVQRNAHRRVAGNDVQCSELLLKAGQRISSSHILPLASLGFKQVEVMRKLRIGIWSTGSEYMTETAGTADVNGPFLQAASREYGAEADFLGYLDDDMPTLSHAFSSHASSGNWDVLITSGAASVGKFDFVHAALEECGGDVVFHGLSIRPGHPVLFAILNRGKKPTALFGLPGNPGAAAACFRFLVIPYLRRLEGREPEKPIPATITTNERHGRQRTGIHEKSMSSSRNLDCFWPGSLEKTTSGKNIVHLEACKSPARLQPYIYANCWVHIPMGQEISVGDIVSCYPTALSAV